MKRKEKLTTFVFIMLALLMAMTAIAIVLAYRTSETPQNVTYPSFTYHYEFSKQLLSERDDNITVSLQNDGDVPLNISVWVELPSSYSAKTCSQYAPYLAGLGVGENVTIQCTVRPNPRTSGTFRAVIRMEDRVQALQKSQPVSLATCYGESVDGGTELRC